MLCKSKGDYKGIKLTMNRPIGSIFWYYGTLLKVVPYENNESNDCKNCYIKLRYKYVFLVGL